ncbi:hypothetical protein F8S20_26500 [Nostoc sp. BAE]|nr:hypothetical protein [Nostoc commune BAE]
MVVKIWSNMNASLPQAGNRRLWSGSCNKGTKEAIAYIRRTFTKRLYRVIHINRVYKFTIIIYYQHSVCTFATIYTSA